MSDAPTITLLDAHGAAYGEPGRTRRCYRLEGGALAPQWAAEVREGEVAWCEISVWGDGDERHVGSYGGEVWPTAWPQLFVPASTHGAALRITPAGLAALDAALPVLPA